MSDRKVTINFSNFFLGALTLVMFTLKLLDIGIAGELSWWLVFAPIWVPLLVILAILLVAGIVMFCIEYRKEKTRRRA